MQQPVAHGLKPVAHEVATHCELEQPVAVTFVVGHSEQVPLHGR